MKAILAAAWLGALCGCASNPASPSPARSARSAAQTPLRVSARAANRDGSVLIVEYHNISKKEARWDRSVKRFKADLERLDAMGFRPVLLDDYLADRMDLPPGASPVVFTFDDSDPTQFKMLPDGKLDPNCAVGIWAAFAAKHPDFPIKATFYVLPPVPWDQKDSLDSKLRMLKDWGCEIGCHTYSHADLGKLTDAQVRDEIAKSLDFIAKLGFRADSIALPYGINPKNAALLHGFTRNGRTYGFRSALLVGAGPAPSPRSPKLNPFRLPRIQGIEGEFGITYWLDRVRDGGVHAYVAP